MQDDDSSRAHGLFSRVKRDILLVFHEYAAHGYINEFPGWGYDFDLPYWDFLNNPGLDPPDDCFFRDGCLIILLGMALDPIDGAGDYIRQYVPICRERFREVPEIDDRSGRLFLAVQLAFDLIDRDRPWESDDHKLLFIEVGWAYKAFVQAYYRDFVEEFERREKKGRR